MRRLEEEDQVETGSEMEIAKHGNGSGPVLGACVEAVCTPEWWTRDGKIQDEGHGEA